jgi:hypothetical protein
MNVDITGHDEHTLTGAREAVDRAIQEGGDATVVISELQNAGILLRERTEDIEGVSDGYHTFGELYDHRRALTAALAAERADISWRSKAHHPDDSPMFEGGYFIMGIDTPHGTITYHYKLTHWDDFDAVPEWPHAPKWDGATPGDTVTRLLAWARGGEEVPVQMTATTRVITQIGDDPGRTRTDVWS